MWDLPRPGLEPVFPALAGRPSTTAPPGKPLQYYFSQRQRLPESPFPLDWRCRVFHLCKTRCVWPNGDIHLRLCVSQSKSLIQTRVQYLVTRGEIWDKGKRTPWWGRICVDMFRAHLIITLSLDTFTTGPCRRGEPTRAQLCQMTWTSGSS